MNLIDTFSPILENARVANVTDFRGGFDNFWSTLTSSVPGLTTVMNIIGIILVVFAIISYLWQHRRGTNWSGGTQIITGSLVVGGALMAPGLILPLILGAFDWIIEFGVNLFSPALDA